MDAKAIWKQNGLKFLGTADSGAEVGMASSMDEGEVGFSPMELLGVGLAGCTGMDVISILRKKKVEVTDFEVSAEIERAEEHPRIFTKIQLIYKVSGKNIERKDVERAVELSENKYCPAQAMLEKTAEISHKIIIEEAE